MDPLLQAWRWQTFPELNGRGFRCLTEGQDGSMWFGVDDGVYRYDGLSWILYTPKNGLVGAPVTVLFSASDGSIYAGTKNGISKFLNNSWETIFSFADSSEGEISDLVQTPDGSLWVATHQGLINLHKGTITLYGLGN